MSTTSTADDGLECINARLSTFGVAVAEGAPGMGRGLFALRSFAEGEVMLRTVPLVIVAMDEWQRNVCMMCMHFSWRKHLTTPCEGRCGDHYCSLSCRDAAKALHAPRCAALRAVTDEICRRKKFDEIAATSAYYRVLARVLTLFLCERLAARTNGATASHGNAVCTAGTPSHVLPHVPTYADCLALEANRASVGEDRIGLMKRVYRTVANVLSPSPSLPVIPVSDSSDPRAACSSLCPPSDTQRSAHAMGEGDKHGAVGKRKHARLAKTHTQPQSAVEKMALFPAGDFPEEDECVDLLCRESCNSFGYRDSDRELYAFALHPLGAFFNHSCEPNAVRKYEGTKIDFVASQRVDAGAEITIAYGDVTACLELRQSFLSDTFHFKCACARCVREATAAVAAPN